MKRIAAAALCLALAGAAPAGEPELRVDLTSDFGDEGRWTEAFARDAGRALVALMATPEVAPPAVLRITLRRDANSAGIAGWASPEGVGFASSSWPREKHRLWIVAHELANQFAAHYAGAGGFPSDWWADGRSPFPQYVAGLVLRATKEDAAAAWIEKEKADEPDVRLFRRLHERHGFALFARCFRLLRADGVDLGRIGAPWPAPDQRRSAYAIAYLSAAAGTNLAATFRDHRVGREPSDWRQRHPEIQFAEYEVSDADVDAILGARAWLFGKAADPAHHEGLRDAFRRGGALGAAQPPGPRVRVASEFAPESDWVEAFCGDVARVCVGAFGGADRPPPREISVRLARDPSLGGIGGGPEDGGLRYVSNVWPDEPFRHWILARDVARRLLDHYGAGGVSPEVAAPDAIGDVLAVAALREAGRGASADWLAAQMGSPPRARARALLGAAPLARAARFAKLLREDGVELSRVAAAERAAYAVAYLSAAAGEDLSAAAGVDAEAVRAVRSRTRR